MSCYRIAAVQNKEAAAKKAEQDKADAEAKKKRENELILVVSHLKLGRCMFSLT
jgi:hypothetical protein